MGPNRIWEYFKADPFWGRSSYLYRGLFDQLFPPQCAATVKKWIPIWTKETDPSGRVSEVHVASTIQVSSTKGGASTIQVTSMESLAVSV